MDRDAASKIPLAGIDLRDRSFVVTFGRDCSPLAASIAEAGLINPPVLAPRPGTAAYRIVCGYLRVQALRQLGAAEIPARILQPGEADAGMLALALHDNLSQRRFNPVEQAGAVVRLLRYLSEAEVMSRWLPLLGLPPTMKALDSCLRIDGLEQELKEALAEGRLSAHGAAELALLQPDERRALFNLFSAVHLSLSKQAEVIETCCDIARRDAVGISRLLQSDALKNIVAGPGPNLPQKGEEARAWLRRLRFPRLAAREERFAALAKKLPRAGGVRLLPPPSFEGGAYRIEIAFSRREKLAEAARAVSALAEDPCLDELLEGEQ